MIPRDFALRALEVLEEHEDCLVQDGEPMGCRHCLGDRERHEPDCKLAALIAELREAVK